MAGLLATSVIAFLVLLLVHLFWRKDDKKSIVQKKPKKPNEPIEFSLQNIKFPPLVGWRLHLMACIMKWRFTSFLKDVIVEQALRQSNFYFLRQSRNPDPPTFLPQVRPSKKQEEHKAPDFEALLKNRSKKKGFSFQSISELVDAYRNGETTPLQVTENALKAIQHSENVDVQLKAFVQYNKADALQMAQSSTERYAERKPLSIIDGVPVGMKEDLEIVGYHRRCGTTFVGNEPEKKDSNLVVKLRELGAVILGMTNMHEMGMGTTGNNPNSLHGTPRNPYNLAYHTGGSSSGSACAVAAGLCPVAIGEDGGGSIRMPASLCGIVGIKATFGRITCHSFEDLGSTSVHHAGPICNNVRDTAIMYALLSGRDIDYFPGLIQPEHATLEGFENTDLSDIKVGIDCAFAELADKEVVDHFKTAVRYIKDQGATVSSIQIPELEECRIAHGIIIGSEGFASFRNSFPNQATKQNPETFLFSTFYENCPVFDYLLAQKQRTRAIEFMKAIFSEVDCVLTPATGSTAPEIPKDSVKYGMSDAGTTGLLMRYSFLGNLTGVPGVVVPIGYDGNGLPVGLQVITAWWEEHVAFRVAHSVESMVTKEQPQLHYNILKPS